MLRAALVLTMFVLAASAHGDDKADQKASVGQWKIEKAELGGVDSLAALKEFTLEIPAEGKYTLRAGEKVLETGTVTVDSAKTPKQMDIKATDGPNKGKTILAVYKIDGDTMTVCYELGGG